MLWVQAVIYGSYLYLFCEFLIKRFFSKGKAAAGAGAGAAAAANGSKKAGAAAAANGNGNGAAHTKKSQ